MTDAVLITGARALTMSVGDRPRRGAAMGELAAIDDAWVLIEGDRIARVASGPIDAPDAARVEARGRVLMPAFVDAHTHLCWAGDRLDEWDARLGGASYSGQLGAGGGIMSTVRAVRAATVDELTDALCARLAVVLAEGTASIEVKTGYGLTAEGEIKMLDAIDAARARWPGRVAATACIGHAKDPDDTDPVGRTIGEVLPAVTARAPGVTIDAYVERGAWSVAETVRLFEAAAAAGHPLRVHADQFAELGMIDAAIALGARSVDHLEASSAASLGRLARSRTMGVMLPCSGFHLDGRYADGRRFVDSGGALAIATNANPGSAPCLSVPMAVGLAVRRLGLTPAEAIAACTVNAAHLLGLPDAGVIEPGARADLVLLRHADERELAHEFGGRHADAVWCGGRRIDPASVC